MTIKNLENSLKSTRSSSLARNPMARSLELRNALLKGTCWQRQNSLSAKSPWAGATLPKLTLSLSSQKHLPKFTQTVSSQEQ